MQSELLNYLERNNVFIRNVTHSEAVMDCVRITIGTKDQMSRVYKLFVEYVNSTKS